MPNNNNHHHHYYYRPLLFWRSSSSSSSSSFGCLLLLALQLLAFLPSTNIISNAQSEEAAGAGAGAAPSLFGDESSSIDETRLLQNNNNFNNNNNNANNNNANNNNNNNNICIHADMPPTTTSNKGNSNNNQPNSATVSNRFKKRTLPTSSNNVIDQVLSYLDEHRPTIESTILQSYTDQYQNVTLPSTQYLYDDFRGALEWMARVGVPTSEAAAVNNNNNGGEEQERHTFFMGVDNCDNDGWHVGLANVAMFLGQSMTMVILNDTCDELNWEMIFPDPNAEIPEGFYPVSNACGQNGVSYQKSLPNTCPAGEEMFECEVDPNMKLTSVSESIHEGDHPPPLECFPRTNEQTVTGHYDPTFLNEDLGGIMINVEGDVIPSKLGRTDVEGCCWWGRGALHTKGVCNLGKLNYYLGARGAREDRNTRYPDVDFCKNPEAICSDETRTMEMRWIVALFEWSERIQSYNDAETGWSYIEELTKFTTEEGDFLGSVQFSLQQNEPPHFLDEVGGILEQGCPFPPCIPEKPQRLRWRHFRKRNFITAAQGVGLPVKSKLFRETEEHFMDPSIRAIFEDSLLQSKSPIDGKMYQSYRYHFTDFMESLRKMADIGFGEDNFFYIGQGERDANLAEISGMLNIAIFLSYAIEMSILDDACDEHNTQLVNGRFPVSNSCGMYGAHYQDMICGRLEDKGTECPLDINQSFSAVTRTLDHRAPQPFKCAPKSQFPVTGFWDETRLEENHKTAFTNQIGRIDVEGCCWWGRGALRQVTQGRCFFGQLNYHIGKRAATEGRPSMYPKIDFCEFPEAICASEHSNELRWVSGMFYWIKQVQLFDNNRWNYIQKLKEMSRTVGAGGGELDIEFLASVDCVLREGKSVCNSNETIAERLNDVLNLITGFNLPTQSPTATMPPTEYPTVSPTLDPTYEPTSLPTTTMPPTVAPNIFWWPTRQDVDFITKIISEKRSAIERKILTPRVEINDENLYTFDEFLASLRVLADGTVPGFYFYVGHSTTSNRNNRLRGLVNIAAFLAHVKTETIYHSICDERNVDSIEGKFPLSNACGQYGVSYQNMRCGPEESHMECPPDPRLQMTAIAPLTEFDPAIAEQNGAPEFFCAPKEHFPFTGYYDGESSTLINKQPFSNRAGRTDVQSCCWWGRGAMQMKGVCMYGKLNYYMGARAREEGRRSLFPDINFCQNPQAVCSGKYSYSLMWATGLFTWVELVQSQSQYSENLDTIAEGGMAKEIFIDAVSDILGSSEEDRIVIRSNFEDAVDALGLSL